MNWTTKLKVCTAGVIGFANVGLALARTVVQATAKQEGFDLTCIPHPLYPGVSVTLLTALQIQLPAPLPTRPPNLLLQS